MASPVIVGVDPLEPDAAPVLLGAAVARLTGAPLVVAASFLHDSISNAVSAGTVDADLRGEAEQALHVLAGHLDAERLVIGGPSAARVLHDLAGARAAGLLVVGSSRRGRLGRIAPGTTAERLAHGATCAVAVAPRGLATDWTPRAIGAGFVDVDEGRTALRAAAALARLTGGRLEAVTAVPPLLRARGAAIAPYDTGAGSHAAAEAATVALRSALRSLGRDPAEGVVVTGEPADALVALSERVDLVVCGSRGYGPAESVLMGSVAHGLLREAHAPVLIIPRGVQDAVERLLPAGAASSLA